MLQRISFALLVLILSASIQSARAAGAEFDLVGPQVEVRVIRNNKGLPIAQVPNLRPGDKVWVHPVLPEDQAVRYILVIAFLRGPTNPPPDGWFTRTETWSKEVREEGMHVTVPQGAQQALLFLAPETGGDFTTLRSTVQGKPGAFVRASQDLYRLSLDRSRLNVYLNGVEEASSRAPGELQSRSLLLARSLNIKLDRACFDKPTEQQMSCLTQNTDQLVMDDPHSQSMVATLTTGASADLIGALGGSPLARGGLYSPYIGAVVDVARILGNLHSARYQYIPALALPRQYDMNLRLNNPPSFRNPKSVLVAALPGVETTQLPPMRAVEPERATCLQKSPLVLPVEGAPLVYSTELGHDFVLHLESKAGKSRDFPAKPDPELGGFVIDTHALLANEFDGDLTGKLQGYWGFEKFAGPSFRFHVARAAQWRVPSDDASALIVGRRDTIHLDSESACCVEEVQFKDAKAGLIPATWRVSKPNQLEVKVSLEYAEAGEATILVKQAGLAKPDSVALRTYSEAAHLDSFVINAGDREGLLRGTRLDAVASLDFHGQKFAPAGLTRVQQKDELRMTSDVAVEMNSAENPDARVTLKDGRVLDVHTDMESPRPRVSLISKAVTPVLASPGMIQLGSPDDLPRNGQLSFVVKSEIPASFPYDEKIEVTTADGAFDILLSTADGSLVLQDAQTVIGKLDAAKSFGASAFGALRFRPVDTSGKKGDWQALVRLVRLPTLTDLHCAPGLAALCTLSGTNLFLIDSISADPQFSNPVAVPIGYMATTLNVPRPGLNAPLYFKLRDDPAAINSVLLPVTRTK